MNNLVNGLWRWATSFVLLKNYARTSRHEDQNKLYIYKMKKTKKKT